MLGGVMGGGAPLAPPGQIVILPLSAQSIGPLLWTMGQVTSSTPGAAAWPASGLVIYIPFWVPEPMLVTKMMWVNGANAGNVDLGIYAEDGTLLVSSGSIAPAGGAIVQVTDVADTLLARGRYYMAMVADTVTTLTLGRYAPAAGLCQAMGLLEQASVTLPLSTGASPATFAKYTRAYVPMFGLQGYRTLGP